MGRYIDVVQTRVEIDGKEALNALGLLEAEASDLKAEMKSLKKETTQYERAVKKMEGLELKIKGLDQLEKDTENAKKQADELFAKYKKGMANLDANAQFLPPDVFAEEEAHLKELKTKAQELRKVYQDNRKELSNTKLATKQYEKAKQKVDELKESADKYRESSEKLSLVNQEVDKHREKLGLAGMTMKQLANLQRQLTGELRNMTQGTAQYDKLKTKLQDVDKALSNQRNELRDTRTAWQKMKDSMSGFMGMAGGIIGGELVLGAFEGITEKIMMSVDGAAKLSDQLSDIQKKSGLSKEEVAQLNAEFSKIKTRTSSSELREMAIVGGSLGFGKTKEELLGFVQTMDKVVVALGDEFTGGATEASRALGGLQKLFKETQNLNPGEAIERIASAINSLGNAGSATAPEVSEFTKRLGALGNLKPSIEQTLGLGAALIELGLSADTGAGGVTAIMLQAGKETKLFAEQIGITEGEFKKLLNTDPNEMFLRLAKSFKGLSNEQVIKALDRMKVGSQESVKVMGLLATKTDFVVEKQKLAAAEFAKNSSLQNEFNLKMSNFAAQLDLAKKKINAFEAGITKAMLPALTSGIEGFVFFLEVLKALPKFLKENKAYIYLIATALVAYNAQLILSKTNQTILLGIQKLGIAQDKIDNLLKARKLGLEKQNNAQSLISQRNQIKETALKIRSNAIDLIKATRLTAVTAAQWAWNAALTANPIGIVIVAIAALVAGLIYAYQNFEVVRNSVNGLWSGIKEMVSIVLELHHAFLSLDFEKFADTFSNAGKRMGKAWGDGFNAEREKALADQRKKDEEGLYAPGQYTSEQEIRDKKQVYFSDDEVAEGKDKSSEDVIAENVARANKFGADSGKKTGQSDKQKEYEKALADFQKFKDNIAQIERDAYEKSLSDEAQELAKVDAKFQELFDKASDHETKMRALKNPELLAQAEAQSFRIAEQYKKEKADIQTKYAEKLQKERDAFQLARDLAQMTDRQKELHDLDEHYGALIEKAEKLGLDTAQISEEWNTKYAEIDQKYADEELKRIEEQAKKVLEAEKKKQETQNRKDTANAELDVVQAPEEISAIDAKIAQLEVLRDIELQNTELLEEKSLIEERYRQQKLDLEKEKFQVALGYMQSVADIGKQFSDLQFEKELNKSEETKNQKIADLDEQYAQGEMSKEKYEQAKAGIEKKADKDKAKIKTKQAKAEKKWNIVNAIINTAAAVAKVSWNIPQAIITGAIGALQIAKIASQPIPKFAKGGMIPNGASHSDGGISLIDNKTGGAVGEIEGGEPILSKQTYAQNKPLIDSLIFNSLHKNGAPVVPNYQAISQGVQYAKGGILPNPDNNSAVLKNTLESHSDKEIVLKQLLGDVAEIKEILGAKRSAPPFSLDEVVERLMERMADIEEWREGNGI